MVKREDIINRLADKGYTKKSAAYIIDDFVRVISEALVEGEEVMIHGFGTFYVKNIKAHELVDLNKEMMSLPSYKAPKFVAGAQLKRWVREGKIREE